MKNLIIVTISLCCLAVLVGSFAGCKRAVSAKLAEIDGSIVSAEDFEKFAGKEYARQRESLYRFQKQKLEEYVGGVLLTREAQRQGVSVEALLEKEVNVKAGAVTDGEVETFYNSNKSRLLVELDKVRDQIRDYLSEQKRQTVKTKYLASLRSKAKIVTYLDPPQLFRAALLLSGAPFKGSENAVITLVKFEDFQCPYCKTVQPRFSQILTKYSGKVRLVHKDLPLDAIHPQARQAAEAARCAGDQGKFWEYHDKLYEHSPKSSVDDLKTYAKEIGLDANNFERCFTGGKHKATVQKDLTEGASLGLTGTPAFFINGRELSGAQPLEAFTAIIDEELALAK